MLQRIETVSYAQKEQADKKISVVEKNNFNRYIYWTNTNKTHGMSIVDIIMYLAYH